jgi:hypothetical protein
MSGNSKDDFVGLGASAGFIVGASVACRVGISVGLELGDAVGLAVTKRAQALDVASIQVGLNDWN